MAIWQHDTTGERFDDGLSAKPGEDAFTRDLAAAHYKGEAFSYVGTPDWAAAVEDGVAGDQPTD